MKIKKQRKRKKSEKIINGTNTIRVKYWCCWSC